LTFDNFCRVHQGGRGDADVITEILESQLSKREFVERGGKNREFLLFFQIENFWKGKKNSRKAARDKSANDAHTKDS